MRTISALKLLVDGSLVGPGTIVTERGTIVEVLMGDQRGTTTTARVARTTSGSRSGY